MKRVKWYIFSIVCIIALGCSTNRVAVAELKHFPVDDLEGIITQTDVGIDKNISRDGNGSLRIIATEPKIIRLYETGDIDLENARLTYQANIRTEGVQGKVFLEMWCSFPGKGEYFSRALHAPLSGSNEWTSQETSFFLQENDNPDNVKLNIVINGTGTVWIDDIHLKKGPLK